MRSTLHLWLRHGSRHYPTRSLLSILADCAGGYFATAGKDPSILLRMKEDYDGAEPAASSYALSNLLRLAALASPQEARASLPPRHPHTLHLKAS